MKHFNLKTTATTTAKFWCLLNFCCLLIIYRWKVLAWYTWAHAEKTQRAPKLQEAGKIGQIKVKGVFEGTVKALAE